MSAVRRPGVPSPDRSVSEQLRLPLRPGAGGPVEPWVDSASNRQAARRLADWPDGIDSVLVLTGPPGSGKSRLAERWAERVGAAPLHGAEAAQADPLELEGRPVLLDGAHQADEESLFHLINLARSAGGALLMVTPTPPSQWAVRLPDLRSRLDAAPMVALEAPDDAVLGAMLRARFAERGIQPGRGVIDYLVRRIDRSAAAAQAVAIRLDALQQPVTRALARQAIEKPTHGSVCHEPE